jgi:thiopeptide-type bacteriocin biosynthesis protein
MRQKNIEFVKNVMLRTPSVPFQEALDNDTLFTQIREDKAFHRALLVANPFVHRRLLEWCSGQLTERRKIDKLKDTLVNYYTRMYSNPTPFGLFGSVSGLEWRKGESSVVLDGMRPAVRLDMEALSKLSKHIEGHSWCRESLRYFSNNTIYKIGDQLRYIESYTDHGGSIQYRLSGVETSDFLAEILQKARKGSRLFDLALEVGRSGEYEVDEIYGFLEELVEAQLLVSELQLTISGPDPFERLYETALTLPLEGNPSYVQVCGRLKSIRDLLASMEDTPEMLPAHLDSLQKLFEEFNLPADASKLVQVDMAGAISSSFLDDSLSENLAEATEVLSYFNQDSRIQRLEEFRNKFISKYENAEVPLMEAIDTESGISFGAFAYQSDNALLKDVQFIESKDEYQSKSPQGDWAKAVLNKKFVEALLNKSYTVQLDEKDFPPQKVKSKVERMAPTCQVIFSVVDAEKKLLHLATAGNGSGGNLIARFAYCSPPLYQMLREVGDFEASYFQNAIVAEVVHIPEHRMGNLCFRPFFRQYELPVMTRSLADEEFQVALDDLLVSVKGGRIVLFSKSLNRRIIPMITNAHNYSKGTCPVYQFLGELQYQDIIPSLALDRSDLHFFNRFVPRVQYKNVILHKASWAFEEKDLLELFSAMPCPDKQLLDAFRLEWQVPELTEYISKGMTMLVDWNSQPSVCNFLRYAKELPSVYLQEFLFNPKSSLVTDAAGRPYFNQCLAVFRNTLRARPADYRLSGPYGKAETIRKFFPSDEWLYLKVYCGVGTSDKILKNLMPGILRYLYGTGLIRGFFFIRYKDPDYHLRLRFLTDPGNLQTVTSFIKEQMKDHLANNLVWKMQVDTYVREIERYGAETIGVAEAVFEADSSYHIGLLGSLEGEYAWNMPFLFMAGVDAILRGFRQELNSRASLFEYIHDNYYKEFKVGDQQSFHDSLSAVELANRKTVEHVMAQDYSDLTEVIDPGRLAQLLLGLEQQVAAIYREKELLFTVKYTLHDMLPSLLHMHAIRCFQVKPRENELVTYTLLDRYYKKKLAILKKDNAPATA